MFPEKLTNYLGPHGKKANFCFYEKYKINCN